MEGWNGLPGPRGGCPFPRLRLGEPVAWTWMRMHRRLPDVKSLFSQPRLSKSRVDTPLLLSLPALGFRAGCLS